jgi:glycosyltransferase involved in cell wall biosynthesis
MRICFFAKAPNKQFLEERGYYWEDIEILRELGHEVILATSFKEIPWNCDLYFTWWYGWGVLSLVKSKLAGKPNIMVGPIHYHDKEFGFFQRPVLQQWLIRLSLRLAEAAVTVSEIEFEGICMLGARRPYMAYHSIVAPELVPGFAEREQVVFSIGHLHAVGIARKGFENVVRSIPLVLKEFPAAHFVMAGRPDDGFEKLVSLRRELGIEAFLDFPGAIDRRTRTEYLRRARVLVQPGTYEGFGLAQLEAMSYGVPVITSRVGAVSEVVADCGLYCDKDDPKDIAKQICRLLGDTELWSELSRGGRERAIMKFGRERRRKQIADIIQTVSASASQQEAVSRLQATVRRMKGDR